LGEFSPSVLPTKNEQTDIVLSLKKSDDTGASVTLYRCKYVGITNATQGRDSVSASKALFVYNAGGTEKDIYTP
jgi:hypothetical protein